LFASMKASRYSWQAPSEEKGDNSPPIIENGLQQWLQD
jgi:hypothetical protein